MRRVEPLPAAVGEENVQRLLPSGAEPERDERVIAHGGGQHEVTHALRAVEYFQPSEIERLGLREKPSLRESQDAVAEMTGGHFNVQQVIESVRPVRDP